MKERKNRNCNWKAIVSEAIHQHQHYYYDHHKDRQTIDLTQKVRPNTDTNGTPVPRLGCCCCVTVGITGEHFFVANTTKSLDERTPKAEFVFGDADDQRADGHYHNFEKFYPSFFK